MKFLEIVTIGYLWCFCHSWRVSQYPFSTALCLPHLKWKPSLYHILLNLSPVGLSGPLSWIHFGSPLPRVLVNLSLSTGSVDGTKSAYLTPLIKGSSLDINNLKNYRPVSNLCFVGKIIEKVVLKRLNEHLNKNNLNIDHQSAYKNGFSTETLLIRVVNDLLKATVVMILDLSAAFDTLAHSTLLAKLRAAGINGIPLKWFQSYLNGRFQSVLWDGDLSNSLKWK